MGDASILSGMAGQATDAGRPTGGRAGGLFAGAVVVGCLLSLILGWYGNHHQPAFNTSFTLGFANQIAMKAWLALVVGVLAVVQVMTSFGIYGKFGRERSAAITLTHRISGLVAVIVSLPIAFTCLWSLGFQDYSTRVMLHSVFGCLFYGAFVAKMLALRIKGLPGWAIPVIGGATFAILVGVLSTSMVWWFTSGRPTY
jgi:hypothetical protein